jgi:hypothetical protein
MPTLEPCRRRRKETLIKMNGLVDSWINGPSQSIIHYPSIHPVRVSLRRLLQFMAPVQAGKRTEATHAPVGRERLRFTRRTGALMIEFLVAMALVMGALVPLAFSFAKEKRLARALYQRAVAMEIVDGEIEVLAAGGWKALTNGVAEFPVRASAAMNLPPGRFLVTRADKRIRLEWIPAVRQHGGAVVREMVLP